MDRAPATRARPARRWSTHRVTGPGQAPSRGRRRDAAGSRGSPMRAGSARGWSRTRAPHLPRNTTQADSRTKADARRTREIELTVAHPEQHLRVPAQVTELVDLVVPVPRGAEMRARRMRRIQHVGDEGLRPRMAVEASAHEHAVLVPGVTRVRRGVDGEQGEVAGAHTVEDRGLLLSAPWSLADREECERAGVAQRGGADRGTSSTRCWLNPCSSATCATPTAAWSSTPCTPAGPSR